MIERKLRVVVLMGGSSNEKETSLDSGRNVVYKLSSKKYDVIPVFVDKNNKLYPLTTRLLVHNATSEIELGLDRSTRINWHDLPKIADFVFIGLHGGSGENGSVQGALEMLELPYNGPRIMASALCMDKYKTNSFLRKCGFSVPNHFLITKSEWENARSECLKNITKILSYPLIVKPHNDGCSVFVARIENDQELEFYIDKLLTQTKSHALIEECIMGMELTVGVVGNEFPKALPPSQSIAQGGVLSMEEKFLPGAGENQTPAPVSLEILHLIQDTIARAYKALGCVGYSRIDCFYQNASQSPTGSDRIVILECNTLPALTPATCLFHQAAELDITPSNFLDLIISLGLQEHRKTFGDASEIASIKEFELSPLLSQFESQLTM